MDKMREAMIDQDGAVWEKIGGAWSLYKPAQSAAVPVVGDVDCYDAGLLSDFGGGNVEWWQDYIRAELARAHEFYASQSAPEVVPIVSKTVGYLAGGTLMRRKIQGYNCKPLIVQPTTSITAAELDALRKDAEKWRDLCERAGVNPSGTISYAGPLEGAPEDLAAIAQGKGE